MRSFFVMFLLTFLSNLSARAQDCSCNADPQVDRIVTSTSSQGKRLILRFPGSPITTQTDVGFLCHEPSGNLELARLWMPAHGHGSAPTRLFAVRSDCTRIERVRFSMAGVWEIQLTYSDGDTGTLSFPVIRQ